MKNKIEIKGALRSVNILTGALWFGTCIESDLPFNGKVLEYDYGETMLECIKRAIEELEGSSFNGLSISYDAAVGTILKD